MFHPSYSHFWITQTQFGEVHHILKFSAFFFSNTRAIRKVISTKLLTKQAMRKKNHMLKVVFRKFYEAQSQ
jgi:hypothetical protein